MAFFYNTFSEMSIEEQWVDYCQNQSCTISNVSEIITQYRATFQEIINKVSPGYSNTIKQGSGSLNALMKVCGNLDEGFTLISEYLQDMNCNISALGGEINSMSAILDWKLSLLIEKQRLMNYSSRSINEILAIPEGQKQNVYYVGQDSRCFMGDISTLLFRPLDDDRVYYIGKGLEYLYRAILEGIESKYYINALENFKKAEKIEQRDYITLSSIGQIYLYSKKLLNIKLSKDYFLKSAIAISLEALAERKIPFTFIKPTGQLSTIYTYNPRKAALAETYLYLGRTCYLMQNLSEAATFAGKAYSLTPEFLEAGFEQAKFLAADNKTEEAIINLSTIIKEDRYYSLKTLSDEELISKQTICKLLYQMQKSTHFKAQKKLSECKKIIQSGSTGKNIIDKIEIQISKNNFLSDMKALDLLNKEYELPIKHYELLDGGQLETNIYQHRDTIAKLISTENENEEQRLRFRLKVLKTNILTRLCIGIGIGLGIGAVIGFFRGSNLNTFSMNGRTLFNNILLFGCIGLLIGFIVGCSTRLKKAEQ
jgi:tetratricopeptide (TPR) repeat protein